MFIRLFVFLAGMNPSVRSFLNGQTEQRTSSRAKYYYSVWSVDEGSVPNHATIFLHCKNATVSVRILLAVAGSVMTVAYANPD